MRNIWNILQVKPEERKAVRLMVWYSFFMGASIAFFYTAAISLFLHCFDRNMLPYVYMAGGVVIYFLGRIFRIIQRKSSISKIMTWSLLFLIITASLLTIGYIFTFNKWLAFSMFLWINVFLFVHGIIFNGLASSIFTLQQGKRLYSFIGVGEVISNVLGFFSVPLLLKFIKTEHLPLLTLFFLLLTLVVLVMLLRSFWRQLAVRRPSRVPEKKSSRSLTGFFKESFLLQLFILAILPVFGLYFVDYIFFGQTQMAFPQKEVLSGFIGIFFGITALVEFIVKTFVYGRLTGKYGVKPGLIGLPLALLISTFLASLSGTFFGVAAMFSFVVLSKLLMRSLKNSLSDPSYLILLQVMPASERFSFQGKIEGGPKALSNILVGAVIILLTALGLSLIHFNYFFILVLVVWSWAAFRMFQSYQQELRKILSSKSSAQPEEAGEGTGTSDALKPWHERMMDPFSKYDSVLSTGGGARRSLQEVEQLCRSSSADDRLMALMMIPQLGRFQSLGLLEDLLRDPVPEVRKAAIYRAGMNKSRELWPLLFESLFEEEYGRMAAVALMQAGPSVMKEADQMIKKLESRSLQQRKLVALIAEMGKGEGIKRLRALMSHPDRLVRMEAIRGLVKNHYRVNISEEVYIRQVMEEEVSLIVWSLACLNDISLYSGNDALVRALEHQAVNGKNFLFQLLALMFEPSAISRIQENFNATGREARIYAAELFDMMVSAQVREMLIPLFQNLKMEEILQAYQYQYPQENLDIHDRLIDIILKDYSLVSPWIKACALVKLAEVPSPDTEKVLLAHLVHPEPLLFESAIRTLHTMNPELLEKQSVRFGKELEDRIRKLLDNTDPDEEQWNLMDKVKLLSSLPSFRDIYEEELYPLTHGSRFLLVEAGQEVHLPLVPGKEVVYFSDRTLELLKIPSHHLQIPPGQVLCDFIPVGGITGPQNYRCLEKGTLIELNLERFYTLLCQKPFMLEQMLPVPELTPQP